MCAEAIVTVVDNKHGMLVHLSVGWGVQVEAPMPDEVPVPK